MSQLSEDILKITTFYMGPASKNFLDYQAMHYLNNLKFDDIQKPQVLELAKWIKASACLFIGKQKADELSVKIADLADS